MRLIFPSGEREDGSKLSHLSSKGQSLDDVESLDKKLLQVQSGCWLSLEKKLLCEVKRRNKNKFKNIGKCRMRQLPCLPHADNGLNTCYILLLLLFC